MDYYAPVTIIIACYNEENYIKQKVDSLLDPNEWIPGSQLIIVSGGSTDNTNELLNDYIHLDHVKVILIPYRFSKIKSVNLAMNYAEHEIIVFSDCRQTMRKKSIQHLIKHFNDPSIGTVSCTLIDTKNNHEPSFFRNTLNQIALRESQYTSSLNVFGALYAQRKSVYREIPSDLLFDDLYIVVSTLIQNNILIQEPQAEIYDIHFDDYYKEERIKRLTRGLLIFLTRHGSFIRQLPFLTFIRFITYKYNKLLLPFMFILFFFSSVSLLLWYKQSFILIFVVILILLLLFIKKTRKELFLIWRVNFYFMTATLSFFIKKEQSNEWQKLSSK